MHWQHETALIEIGEEQFGTTRKRRFSQILYVEEVGVRSTRTILVNDLQVLYRVDTVFNMGYFRVFKSSAHMEYAIHCLYMR